MKKSETSKLNDEQIKNLAKEKVTIYICHYGEEAAHKLIKAMAKLIGE